MKQFTEFLDHFPVATFVLIVVVIVGAVDLLIDGNLSKDFQVYMGLVLVGNGGLAIGRGISKR